MLAAAGVVDRRHAPLERPPRRVVARSCCRAAYLRGAFLGARLALARTLAAPRAAHRLGRVGGAPRAARGRRGRRARDRRARNSLRSRTRRAGRRSSRCSRSWARPRPCSRSRSVPSSPRRARVRTGSRTPTTRTSSARTARAEAARRHRRASISTRFRIPARGGGAAARHPDRVRFASSRRAPTRPRRRPPCTAVCVGSKSSVHRLASARTSDEKRRRDGHSRRHQRVRPHRAELLPSAARARVGPRDRRAQRPRRREDHGAPPEVRLESRPVPGRGRACPTAFSAPPAKR